MEHMLLQCAKRLNLMLTLAAAANIEIRYYQNQCPYRKITFRLNFDDKHCCIIITQWGNKLSYYVQSNAPGHMTVDSLHEFKEGPYLSPL